MHVPRGYGLAWPLLSYYLICEQKKKEKEENMSGLRHRYIDNVGGTVYLHGGPERDVYDSGIATGMSDLENVVRRDDGPFALRIPTARTASPRSGVAAPHVPLRLTSPVTGNAHNSIDRSHTLTHPITRCSPLSIIVTDKKKKKKKKKKKRVHPTQNKTPWGANTATNIWNGVLGGNTLYRYEFPITFTVTVVMHAVPPPPPNVPWPAGHVTYAQGLFWAGVVRRFMLQSTRTLQICQN